MLEPKLEPADDAAATPDDTAMFDCPICGERFANEDNFVGSHGMEHGTQKFLMLHITVAHDVERQTDSTEEPPPRQQVSGLQPDPRALPPMPPLTRAPRTIYVVPASSGVRVSEPPALNDRRGYNRVYTNNALSTTSVAGREMAAAHLRNRISTSITNGLIVRRTLGPNEALLPMPTASVGNVKVPVLKVHRTGADLPGRRKRPYINTEMAAEWHRKFTPLTYNDRNAEVPALVKHNSRFRQMRIVCPEGEKPPQSFADMLAKPSASVATARMSAVERPRPAIVDPASCRVFTLPVRPTIVADTSSRVATPAAAASPLCAVVEPGQARAAARAVQVARTATDDDGNTSVRFEPYKTQAERVGLPSSVSMNKQDLDDEHVKQLMQLIKTEPLTGQEPSATSSTGAIVKTEPSSSASSCSEASDDDDGDHGDEAHTTTVQPAITTEPKSEQHSIDSDDAATAAHSSNRKLMKCGFCRMLFYSPNLLNFHLLLKHRDLLQFHYLKCPDCSHPKFNDVKQAVHHRFHCLLARCTYKNTHTQAARTDRVMADLMCPKKAGQPGPAEQHECVLCNEQCDGRAALLRHVHSEHPLLLLLAGRPGAVSGHQPQAVRSSGRRAGILKGVKQAAGACVTLGAQQDMESFMSRWQKRPTVNQPGPRRVQTEQPARRRGRPPRKPVVMTPPPVVNPFRVRPIRPRPDSNDLQRLVLLSGHNATTTTELVVSDANGVSSRSRVSHPVHAAEADSHEAPELQAETEATWSGDTASGWAPFSVRRSPRAQPHDQKSSSCDTSFDIKAEPCDEDEMFREAANDIDTWT